MENREKLLVTSSPHVRSKNTIQSEMRDVIIALIPAGIAAVYYFGYRALILILASVLACVLSEYLFNKATKRKQTVKDLSAVVTGILLAYNVPFTLPVWQIVIGAVFAIVAVKMAFGGIGQNIVNPALAARAFLLASWSESMSTFVPPQRVATLKSVSTISALSAATPLSEPQSYSVMDLFLGNIPGSLGEVSALALLLGCAYLLIRRVINIKMPLIYIATATLLSGLFTGFDNILKDVLSGGLLLGAIFMLTDYTTSPVTPNGQIVYAVLAGVLTAIIRAFGGYPEGVSYSILLSNLVVPIIEKYTRPKVFGVDYSKKKGVANE
ncbi:RnfABCDGE type electron transport complex subunit D [Anaerococcus sp. mt242]|uniref:RnfABCDGE type electron transport complex subunit D n=1 Tax=Anaerococcus sp. mt242 TaxID=2661917 RepID=UPI0019346B3B|nr:RnfABCDGE type electron transport complex subunit D [Anaerococcus sp. mt242]MBM0045923.1 RnfABCDGE type electron transport complex subunit D [Anaerococcus sp. mt242]